MKILGPTLLVGGIITSATYFYTNRVIDEIPQKPIVTIQSENKVIVSQILTNSGIVSVSPINNSFLTFVDKNLTLHIRIQGMGWYRDCISGRLSNDECMGNIENAMKIEEIIKQKPSFLSSIQYETWWQKYLSGIISPENILITHIPAFEQIEEFKLQNNDLYLQISHSPIWNSLQDPNDNGDNLITYQARYLAGIGDIQDTVTNNPDIQKMFEVYNLDTTMLYTETSITVSSSVYNKMNEIIIIENIKKQEKDKFSRFLETEAGKQYLRGNIDLSKVLQFFQST